MTAVLKLIRNFGLLGLWLAATLFLYFNFRREQANPLPHKHHFAEDSADSVLSVIVVMLIEVVVLYLILRPPSYRNSFARPLTALLLFLPWTLVSMMVSMHAGSAVFLHWMWLFMLDCALVVCALVSGGGAIIARRRLRAGYTLACGFRDGGSV